MSKTLLNVFIVVLILALGYLGWNYWSTHKQSTADNSSLSIGTDPNALALKTANEGYLNLLLNLKSIRLDTAFFTSSSFRSLVDFSIPILPEGNEGRPNPFVPIDQNGTTTTDTNTNSMPVSGIK